LPRWPTFCLNLRETRADYAYDGPNDHIWLPTSNLGGIAEEWKRWTGSYSAAFSFLSSIVDAARNWTDTLQAIVPGYRDRIAHIYLDSKQGGLNLNMGMAAVHEIAGYGECAADRLADRFLRGTDKGEATGMTWDNQRWIRYRSTMSVLRGFLSRFAIAMKGPEPGDRGYEELIVREGNALPGSYRFDEEQREVRETLPAGWQIWGKKWETATYPKERRVPSRHFACGRSSRLARSRENERDIIRLLIRADPLVDRACHDLADTLQGKVPIAAHELN